MHVIDSAGIYGAEKMVLNLMKEQQGLGAEPVLLSIEDSPKESLAEESERRGLKTVRFPSARGFRISSALAIVERARELGADIIHSHGYKGDILLGALPRSVRKKPVVSTVHGWIQIKRFSKIWVYKLIDGLCLRRLDAVVSVNGLPLDVGGTDQYDVRNGIPELVFATGRVLDEDKEIKNFIGKGFIVGALSRLSEEKGLFYLIEAIGILSARGIDAKLAVIGEGPERQRLEELASRRGISERVLLAGYRTDAHNYIKSFDVFVIPSLSEGLPITLLEAMQAEVPIVATRVGGIPGVLENGRLGALAAPGSPEGLADAIARVMKAQNEAKEKARAARKTALEKYSSSRMAKDYIEIYERVLEKWKR